MSFRVSRVNRPTLITEEFLPKLEVAGELLKSELKSILGEHRQTSYSGDYITLCTHLGLWTRDDDRFIYNIDNQSLAQDPDRRLFELLFSLPHFRRWLEIRHHGDRRPGVDDITISDEQEQQFLQRRRTMMQKWQNAFDQDSTMADTADLMEEFTTNPIRCSDEFLFYDSYNNYTSEAEQRCTLLILLILAQKDGFSVAFNGASQLLDIEPEQMQSIARDIFAPLAIEVGVGADALSLQSDLILTLNHTSPILNRLGRFGDTEYDPDKQSFNEYLQELSGELIDSGVFTASTTFTGSGASKFRIEVASQMSEENRYGTLNPTDMEQLIEEIWNRSTSEGVVPLPQGEFQELGTFNRALSEALNSEDYGDEIGRMHWRFATLIREPVSILGPAPILTPAKAGHRANRLGKWIAEELPHPTDDVGRLLLFLCNPILRYVSVLAGEGYQLSLDVPHTIRYQNSAIELKDLFQMISDTDLTEFELILPSESQNNAATSVVRTAKWTGFIEQANMRNEFDIDDALNRVLNTHSKASEIYDKEQDNIRQILQEET